MPEANPGDLSSVLGTYRVEGENRLQKVVTPNTGVHTPSPQPPQNDKLKYNFKKEDEISEVARGSSIGAS